METSASPKPQIAPKPELPAFCRLLIEVLKPDKIYCMQQQFIGEAESSCLLLVVLQPSCTRAFTEMQPYLELAGIGYGNCLIVKPNYLVQKLQQGHVFYSMICRKDNLLYDTGKHKDFQSFAPGEQSLVLERARLVFEAQFQAALHCYEGCFFFLQDPQTLGLALFMLHQSAELCLRAVIIFLCGRERRSHEVRILQQCAAQYLPAFAQVFSTHKPEDIALLKKLDDAYTEGRYATVYSISDEDLEMLTKRVDTLHLLASEVVEVLTNGCLVLK
ncbi:HEPN domain-containing protein [Pedobacter sp. HMF7647]|uniref:HEPN domain-containing protein n=1 Tax=Hufsiella arboris TaxID=2695275 RepID=A0A7K1YF22_9SPHI|nr:HEPN domain-containing protein [Hufsiella arboris]MXV53207.1 HEPN domain-containing protein [Hufsiella arboris]